MITVTAQIGAADYCDDQIEAMVGRMELVDGIEFTITKRPGHGVTFELDGHGKHVPWPTSCQVQHAIFGSQPHRKPPTYNKRGRR